MFFLVCVAAKAGVYRPKYFFNNIRITPNEQRMVERHSGRLRRLWRNLHLWLGAGLFILLVPIAISGSLLVWHDHLDALINPGRYAVSSGALQPPSTYVTAARTAVPANFQA